MSNSSVKIYYPYGNWIDNSLGPEIVDIGTVDFVRLNYAVIALSSFILIHSFYLHRFKWSIVRICNDVAAVSVLAMCLLYLQCINTCSVFQSAMIIDFGVNAIFSCLVQITDNYMTFKRYDVVVGKTSSRHRVLVLLYVVLNLYGCWWPFFTIIPFARNMNNDDSVELYTYSQLYWNFPTYVAYDLFYDSLLVYKIYTIRQNSVVNASGGGSKVSHLEMMAYKAISHNICSILAVYCYCFVIPLGVLLQTIIIMVAIHFIFNWSTPVKVINSIGGIVFSKAIKSTQRVYNGLSLRLSRTRKCHVKVHGLGVDRDDVCKSPVVLKDPSVHPESAYRFPPRPRDPSVHPDVSEANVRPFSAIFSLTHRANNDLVVDIDEVDTIAPVGGDDVSASPGRRENRTSITTIANATQCDENCTEIVDPGSVYAGEPSPRRRQSRPRVQNCE